MLLADQVQRGRAVILIIDLLQSLGAPGLGVPTLIIKVPFGFQNESTFLCRLDSRHTTPDMVILMYCPLIVDQSDHHLLWKAQVSLPPADTSGSRAFASPHRNYDPQSATCTMMKSTNPHTGAGLGGPRVAYPR